MNEIISLIINIEVKAGRRQEQIDAFSSISALVLEEVGCLQYELKAVQGDGLLKKHYWLMRSRDL